MKEHSSFFRIAEKGIDFAINVFACYVGYLAAMLHWDDPHDMNGSKQLIAALIIAFVSLAFYSYAGIYRPMRSEREGYYIGRIMTANFFMLCAYLVYAAVFLAEYDLYLYWALTAFLCSTVLLIVKKSSVMAILHRIRGNKHNIKHILLLTDDQEMADEYMRELHLHPDYGYDVIGYVGNCAIDGLKHLGSTPDLDIVLRTHRPDEVVMAFATVRRTTIVKYVSICDDNCVKVWVVPATCGIFKSQRQVKMLGMLPMVDIRSTPLDSTLNRFVKRTTDIVLAIILILLSSPFMLFAAIGVRLSSPGPILFRQERVGRNNKTFTIYKFRSMVVNKDEAKGWTTPHDARKTRFGNFIRKYSIDELPQFFNVLKGDMSIVGPRPEMTKFVEEFRKTVPLYMLKHSVRPGITGLAQIHGLRGDTSIERRIEEDIYYIEHWTWLEDIKIILLTPFKAINKQEKAPERKRHVHSGEEPRDAYTKKNEE